MLIFRLYPGYPQLPDGLGRLHCDAGDHAMVEEAVEISISQNFNTFSLHVEPCLLYTLGGAVYVQMFLGSLRYREGRLMANSYQ